MTSPERITLPNAPDDVNATIARLHDELDAKQPRNLLRASYYDGKRAVRQVGTIIPPQYYRLAIVLGWSAKAVDLLARRCNQRRLRVVRRRPGSPRHGRTDRGEPAQDRDQLGAGASLQHGPAFLINTRGDESAGEPASLIHVKDALNATGEWNNRRRGLDNLLSITGRDTTATPRRSRSTWTASPTPPSGMAAGRGTAHRAPVGRAGRGDGLQAASGRPFGRSRISRP
jgi:hypothetical protein